MRETPIHVQIYSELVKMFPRPALVFHVPNGEKRDPATAMKLKRMGVVRGIPDLVVLLPNQRTVFIEVKTNKGTESSDQKEVKKCITTMGHECIVARSAEDIKKYFSENK